MKKTKVFTIFTIFTKNKAKAIFGLIITIAIIYSSLFGAFAEGLYIQSGATVEESCRSAILMEAETGRVLYEYNADEPLPPASVTKVMTLLLVMEAIDNSQISLSDQVCASAYACSMGGSQIYLKENEVMSVEELLKSVIIASANDAAVALAEYVAGSEDAFVKKMNEKAKELKMSSTNFENTNGLDDTAENHVTSARDIALMSRQLLKYDKILEYSSMWMDTIRNGKFGLTNTNRLIRFYKGANGLKTGSTSKAGFCITATAEKNGMTLISVIMAAPSGDIRNQTAQKLLDHGFNNYSLYKVEGRTIEKINVLGGKKDSLTAGFEKHSVVISVNMKVLEEKIVINDKLTAPVKKGEVIGEVVLATKDGTIVDRIQILSLENVERIDFLCLLGKIWSVISLF